MLCTALLPGCALLSRASEAPTGAQGNRASFAPALSADGRWLAFSSYADNLVPGDTNESIDVFVRDNWTKAVTRVSESSAGGQQHAFGFVDLGVSISDDGRVVAFALGATGLAPNDDNGILVDVFWHDRDADRDGIYDEPGAIATVLASETPAGNAGNRGSAWPVLNGDGDVVAFSSSASDLLAAPDHDANAVSDVFVSRFDLATGQRTSTRIVSRAPAQPLVEANGGSGSPSIDASGNVIAFTTLADNLIAGGSPFTDIVVNDGVQLRLGTGFVQPNSYSDAPALSRDGRYVAYVSKASNLVLGDTVANEEVFVTDYAGSGATVPAIQGYTGTHTVDSGPFVPSISSDGTRVAFLSFDPDLVPGDTNGQPDVFVHDFSSGVTQRVSTNVLLQQGALGASYYNYPDRPVALSADGRFVALATQSNLLEPDANGSVMDVLVRGAMVPVIDSVAAIDPVTHAEIPAVLHPGANQLIVRGGALGPALDAYVDAGVTVSSISGGGARVIVSLEVAPATLAGTRNLIVHNRGTVGALAAGTFQMCSGCVTIAAN